MKLVNQGWESMHLVLDKELPQKKKRRFIIWWLAGLLLVASATLLWMHDDSDNSEFDPGQNYSKELIAENTSSDIEAKKSQPIEIEEVDQNIDDLSAKNTNRKEEAILDKAKTEVVASNNSGDIISQTSKDLTNQPKTSTVISKIEASESVEKIKKTIDNNKSVNNNDDDFVSKRSELPINDIVDTNTATPSGDSKNIDVEKGDALLNMDSPDKNLIENRKDLVENTLDLENTNENSNSIDPITLLSETNNLLMAIPKLTDLELDFGLSYLREIPMTLTKPKPKIPNHWFVDGALTGSYGLNKSMIGADISAIVGLNLRGRFDIAGSIGIGKLQISDMNISDDLVNSRNELSFSETNNLISDALNSVNYLDFGLGVRYHLDSHWSATLGIGTEYLWQSGFEITRTSNKAEVEVLDGGIGAESVDGGTGSMFVNVPIQYELDARWLPYAKYGIGFMAAEKIQLEVSYKDVFKKVFSSSENPIDVDRFQLSLRYRFHSSINK